jgi:hypothetical protein
MAVSSSGSSSDANAREERKSWLARVSQSRTSSLVDSSIELAAFGQNLVKQGCAEMFVAVNLGAGWNKHVFGKAQSCQAAMGALHSPDGFLAALSDNYHQIHIAVIVRNAPRVRTEQINFLRLKLCLQPFHSLVQCAWRNGLHLFQTIIGEKRWKAGVYEQHALNTSAAMDARVVRLRN